MNIIRNKYNFYKKKMICWNKNKIYKRNIKIKNKIFLKIITQKISRKIYEIYYFFWKNNIIFLFFNLVLSFLVNLSTEKFNKYIVFWVIIFLNILIII